MKNDIKGSVSIEASLVLTAFIFAFYFLISFASLARIEAITKNALDQTAKDLSKYAYAVETVATSESNKSELIYKILNYASFENSIAANFSGPDSEVEGMDISMSELGSISDFSGAFAVSIFEKNLIEATNTTTYSESLKKLHINGAIDFSESEIMPDGETIHLVATYTVENPMHVFFEQEVAVKQISSTKCWVGGEGKLNGGGDSTDSSDSIWDLPSTERGQIWLAEYREMRPDEAIESGYGIDFYDGETISAMYSMNIFSSSYCDGNYEDGTCTLDADAISNQLESYIKETVENVENLEEEIPMMDGSMKEVNAPVMIELEIIVPKEAASFASELSAIAAPLEEEYGVTVTWIYQEEAFV